MAINPAILDPRSDSLDARSALIRRAGYWLHLTRALEEAGKRLYLQGKVPGNFYDGRGQEATAVGAALALQERDIACPMIRDMGVHLVRGLEPEELLCTYMGREGGPMRGRDGNVHVGDIGRGTLPLISHLPEMLPIGLGVVLGRTWRGERAACLAFCGDGGSNGGVWHETLNLAGIWHAPFVLIVERNGWSYMTRSASMLAVERVADRAAGYGMAAYTVDGNDAIEVHDVVERALAHARDGAGPALVEAWTYRVHGHGAHDGQRYVPNDELERWKARDPLARWQERARAEAQWTDADQAHLEEVVTSQMRAAVRAALEQPLPSAEGLPGQVFAA
jgi:TPP-dependent pyruvate/acetoin dehydrogenase alpha subunit